jgi:hypothetical protein
MSVTARQRFRHLVTDELTVNSGASLVGGLTVDDAAIWSMLDDGAQVFYCDPTSGGAGNPGTRAKPVNTMAAALALCTDGRGDVIIRFRGGEEVSSTCDFNKAGVTVLCVAAGLAPQFNGEYFSMYSAASLTDAPVAKITARTTIVGMGFVSRDTGATFYDGAALLIGGDADATPYGVHLLQCRFPKWNLDNRIGLAIEGSTDCLIEECYFEGVGASFDSGIYVQGATQNLEVRDCRFRQCTYAILHGAFAGGGPHCIYKGLVCEDSKLLSSSTATGIVADCWLETATDTGSYNDTVNNLNTAGLQFSDIHYAE